MSDKIGAGEGGLAKSQLTLTLHIPLEPTIIRCVNQAGTFINLNHPASQHLFQVRAGDQMS
jgi:hypothetical protein